MKKRRKEESGDPTLKNLNYGRGHVKGEFIPMTAPREIFNDQNLDNSSLQLDLENKGLLELEAMAEKLMKIIALQQEMMRGLELYSNDDDNFSLKYTKEQHAAKVKEQSRRLATHQALLDKIETKILEEYEKRDPS